MAPFDISIAMFTICMYRRTIGQQCCYDADGNYTTNGRSAGSADHSYPMEDYLQHQASDYFPYRACCVDSDDITFCREYYRIRPRESDMSNCNNNNRRGIYICTV